MATNQQQPAAPPQPTDIVSFRLSKPHAEHKAGATIQVTRHIAEKLARPEHGFGAIVSDAPAA